MKRTGIATLPLHYGRAPRWLFDKMSALAGQITEAVVAEFGSDEFFRKISDPYWFQSLGCVLGFDWHSSGLTTTTAGAIKEGIKGKEKELGLFVCGGKGAASRRTPDQIRECAEKLVIDPAPFVYASRISAKVDNSALQDGYQLYHHVFFLNGKGRWAVLQQGMNAETKMARRYHWLGERVENFVIDPHSGICCDERGEVLNLVAPESEEARRMCTLLARESPEIVVGHIALMNDPKKASTLSLPMRHSVSARDVNPQKLRNILALTREHQHADFESLLGTKGVGPMTIRALSLVSEIIYGKAPSFEDPARFSFAHGGKDGTPYPVNRKVFDRTIDAVRKAIETTKIENKHKMEAIKRLSRHFLF